MTTAEQSSELFNRLRKMLNEVTKSKDTEKQDDNKITEEISVDQVISVGG